MKRSCHRMAFVRRKRGDLPHLAAILVVGAIVMAIITTTTTTGVECAKLEPQLKLLIDDEALLLEQSKQRAAAAAAAEGPAVHEQQQLHQQTQQQQPDHFDMYRSSDLRRLSYETIHRILRDENEPIARREDAEMRYYRKRSYQPTHEVFRRAVATPTTPSTVSSSQTSDDDILNMTHSNLTRFLPDDATPIPANWSAVSRLDLSDNALTSVDLAPLPRLREANLSRNRLTALPLPANCEPNVSGCQSLQRLGLSGNRIENLTALKLSSLQGLETLDLSCNRIENLETTFFPQRMHSLRHLNLAHNRLGAVYRETFYNLLSLNTLVLRHNNITDIDYETFLALPNLQYLDLSHNRLRGESIRALQGIPDLVGLSIAHNPELGGSMQEFVASWSLKELDASGTGLCQIPAALAQSVRTLKLTDNWLKVINCGDLDSYPLLQHLDLAHSRIEDIEDDALGRLEILEVLFLDHNELRKVPLSLPTSLQHLFLQQNQIMDVQAQAFQGLNNLQTLDLSGNKLLYLPALPLPRLLTLNLQAAEVRGISQAVVHTLPRLRDMLLEDNPIKCSDLLGIAEWASPCRLPGERPPAVGGIDLRAQFEQTHDFFADFEGDCAPRPETQEVAAEPPACAIELDAEETTTTTKLEAESFDKVVEDQGENFSSELTSVRSATTTRTTTTSAATIISTTSSNSGNNNNKDSPPSGATESLSEFAVEMEPTFATTTKTTLKGRTTTTLSSSTSEIPIKTTTTTIVTSAYSDDANHNETKTEATRTIASATATLTKTTTMSAINSPQTQTQQQHPQQQQQQELGKRGATESQKMPSTSSLNNSKVVGKPENVDAIVDSSNVTTETRIVDSSNVTTETTTQTTTKSSSTTTKAPSTTSRTTVTSRTTTMEPKLTQAISSTIKSDNNYDETNSLLQQQGLKTSTAKGQKDDSSSIAAGTTISYKTNNNSEHKTNKSKEEVKTTPEEDSFERTILNFNGISGQQRAAAALPTTRRTILASRQQNGRHQRQETEQHDAGPTNSINSSSSGNGSHKHEPLQLHIKDRHLIGTPLLMHKGHNILTEPEQLMLPKPSSTSATTSTTAAAAETTASAAAVRMPAANSSASSALSMSSAGAAAKTEAAPTDAGRGNKADILAGNQRGRVEGLAEGYGTGSGEDKPSAAETIKDETNERHEATTSTTTVTTAMPATPAGSGPMQTQEEAVNSHVINGSQSKNNHKSKELRGSAVGAGTSANKKAKHPREDKQKLSLTMKKMTITKHAGGSATPWTGLENPAHHQALNTPHDNEATAAADHQSSRSQLKEPVRSDAIAVKSHKHSTVNTPTAAAQSPERLPLLEREVGPSMQEEPSSEVSQSEQLLDTRKASAAGHPGLVILVSLASFVVLLLGLLRIYRCDKPWRRRHLQRPHQQPLQLGGAGDDGDNGSFLSYHNRQPPPPAGHPPAQRWHHSTRLLPPHSSPLHSLHVRELQKTAVLETQQLHSFGLANSKTNNNNSSSTCVSGSDSANSSRSNSSHFSSAGAIMEDEAFYIEMTPGGSGHAGGQLLPMELLSGSSAAAAAPRAESAVSAKLFGGLAKSAVGDEPTTAMTGDGRQMATMKSTATSRKFGLW